MIIESRAPILFKAACEDSPNFGEIVDLANGLCLCHAILIPETAQS
jgi:hypothetical protein